MGTSDGLPVKPHTAKKSTNVWESNLEEELDEIAPVETGVSNPWSSISDTAVGDGELSLDADDVEDLEQGMRAGLAKVEDEAIELDDGEGEDMTPLLVEPGMMKLTAEDALSDAETELVEASETEDDEETLVEEEDVEAVDEEDLMEADESELVSKVFFEEEEQEVDAEEPVDQAELGEAETEAEYTEESPSELEEEAGAVADNAWESNNEEPVLDTENAWSSNAEAEEAEAAEGESEMLSEGEEEFAEEQEEVAEEEIADEAAEEEEQVELAEEDAEQEELESEAGSLLAQVQDEDLEEEVVESKPQFGVDQAELNLYKSVNKKSSSTAKSSKATKKSSSTTSKKKKSSTKKSSKSKKSLAVVEEEEIVPMNEGPEPEEMEAETAEEEFEMERTDEDMEDLEEAETDMMKAGSEEELVEDEVGENDAEEEEALEAEDEENELEEEENGEEEEAEEMEDVEEEEEEEEIAEEESALAEDDDEEALADDDEEETLADDEDDDAQEEDEEEEEEEEEGLRDEEEVIGGMGDDEEGDNDDEDAAYEDAEDEQPRDTEEHDDDPWNDNQAPRAEILSPNEAMDALEGPSGLRDENYPDDEDLDDAEDHVNEAAENFNPWPQDLPTLSVRETTARSSSPPFDFINSQLEIDSKSESFEFLKVTTQVNEASNTEYTRVIPWKEKLEISLVPGPNQYEITLCGVQKGETCASKSWHGLTRKFDRIDDPPTYQTKYTIEMEKETLYGKIGKSKDIAEMNAVVLFQTQMNAGGSSTGTWTCEYQTTRGSTVEFTCLYAMHDPSPLDYQLKSESQRLTLWKKGASNVAVAQQVSDVAPQYPAKQEGGSGWLNPLFLLALAGTGYWVWKNFFANKSQPKWSTVRQYDEEEIEDTFSEDEKDNPAKEFVRAVLVDLGMPEFSIKKYLKILQDQWISSVEQLGQMSEKDLLSLGFHETLVEEIRRRLSDVKNPRKASSAMQLSKRTPNGGFSKPSRKKKTRLLVDPESEEDVDDEEAWDFDFSD